MNDLSRSPRPSRRVWPLTVVGATQPSDRVRRVRMVCETDGLECRPGQTLVLAIHEAGGGIAWDRRAVQAFDAVEQLVDIDFSLDDASPATLWARTAKLGDAVTVLGPRSRARPLRDPRFLGGARLF